MASKEDPVKAIANSELKDVIVKGFAEVYKVKPDFPVQFLGKWLKNYAQSQAVIRQLDESKDKKEEEVTEMQRKKEEKAKKVVEKNLQKEAQLNKKEADFANKINSTQFHSDLLVEYLPETIQVFCSQRNIPLTGSYIGQLNYRHKKLQEHNFQPGAQLDTENPKVIEYFGASKSHSFMIGQILPNESGRSYEVFKEEEPPAEDEEGKPAQIKKKYVYVPLVQRDEKIHFFKFPKLGSFACFPLKVKSCLFIQSFQKGIGDYKTFVKSKEQIERQYNQKLNEARGNLQEAKRKVEDHEVNEEDPISQGQHSNLQEEVTKMEESLKEIESNPPVIQPFHYQSKIKEYVVCIDTMGKDSQIPDSILTFIESKLELFRQKWEEQQYKMLLDDILTFIEDEPTLETQDNYFRDQQRGIVSSNESQIKEQFPNREKEPQFELTVLKVSKLMKILNEEAYLKSLGTYLSYKIPKYKEIIQIALMLLGYKKHNINLPRSNILDARKYLTKSSIEKMLTQLQKYELRRESSDSVDPEYKINKLLERLEKIDSEAVAKYNSWLSALLIIAKNMCWARIQCRDTKIQAHEAKTKAMNEREAEITKYEEDLEKAIQAAKAEVTEDTPPYNEQEFLKTYTAENPKPERIVVEELKLFQDIE